MLTRKSSLFFAITAAAALVGTANIAHAAKGAKGTHAGGKVTTVDAAAKSFVVERGGKNGKPAKDVTIVTTDKTAFMKGEEKGTWADIKTGVRVQAEGTTGTDGKFTATVVTVAGHKTKAAAPAAK